MTYVLTQGRIGTTTIEARGITHDITFAVNKIENAPMIARRKSDSPITSGTRLTVTWPRERALVSNAYHGNSARIRRICEDFCWLNPHLTLRLVINGETVIDHSATDANWHKWRPRDPTSPHWYDYQRFERYMAAFVARSLKGTNPNMTVREFMSQFRGLTSTIKQKRVLHQLGVAHMPLTKFFGSAKQVNQKQIAKLLEVMKAETEPVKPKLLGVIGKEHLLRMFEAAGGIAKTFKYLKTVKNDGGVPRVIEAMFGLHGSDDDNMKRRTIAGVNWSAGIEDPFRSLGSEGLGFTSYLEQAFVSSSDPVFAFLHVACPRIAFRDRGKSSIDVED
jgi:hypothetical protein